MNRGWVQMPSGTGDIEVSISSQVEIWYRLTIFTIRGQILCQGGFVLPLVKRGYNPIVKLELAEWYDIISAQSFTPFIVHPLSSMVMCCRLD